MLTALVAAEPEVPFKGPWQDAASEASCIDPAKDVNDAVSVGHASLLDLD